MNRTLRFRRDISSTWLRVNPVLALGEPGYEKDTNRFKIGDGVARWVDLEYFVPGDTSALYAELSARIDEIIANPPVPPDEDGPSLLLLYMNAKV